MSRDVGHHPQGHSVSQNQGINWRSSGLQTLWTLCITWCESVSCSVMSNSLQPSVCFRETGVWKKRKRFSCESTAHLPVDLPVILWPGDCVVESQLVSGTGLGEELPVQTVGMSFSHTTCLNLELPDGACPNHRMARLSPGYFRSRENSNKYTRMLNSYKIRLGAWYPPEGKYPLLHNVELVISNSKWHY